MRFVDMRRLALPSRVVSRWKRDNRCVWCNRGVAYRKRPRRYKPTLATREHLVPKRWGGGGGRNLAVACSRCNNRRGSSLDWVPWLYVPADLRRMGFAYRRVGDNYVAAVKP